MKGERTNNQKKNGVSHCDYSSLGFFRNWTNTYYLLKIANLIFYQINRKLPHDLLKRANTLSFSKIIGKWPLSSPNKLLGNTVQYFKLPYVSYTQQLKVL